MFTSASLIFIIFTAVYLVFSIAVIYHLRKYTLPGNRTPERVTKIFIIISLVLWIAALLFLFAISLGTPFYPHA